MAQKPPLQERNPPSPPPSPRPRRRTLSPSSCGKTEGGEGHQTAPRASPHLRGDQTAAIGRRRTSLRARLLMRAPAQRPFARELRTLRALEPQTRPPGENTCAEPPPRRSEGWVQCVPWGAPACAGNSLGQAGRAAAGAAGPEARNAVRTVELWSGGRHLGLLLFPARARRQAAVRALPGAVAVWACSSTFRRTRPRPRRARRACGAAARDMTWALELREEEQGSARFERKG